MVGDPLKEAIVGLGGVVLGGLIAWATNFFFAWREERDRRLAVAYSIVFKVQHASDLIIQAARHVAKAQRDASERGWQLWQAMMEWIGDEREPVSFESAELTLFAVHNDAEFANDLLELARAHNLLVVLFREYNRRRDEFAEKTTGSGTVSLTEQVASFESTAQTAPLLALRLTQLAQSIENVSVGGCEHAKMVTTALTPKLIAILKDKRFRVKVA